MTHNPNCDGGHCREEHGEVRVYPLGAGGNLILCQTCWAHENRYRYERAREYNGPKSSHDIAGTEGEKLWPQEDWYQAKVYENA